MPKYNNKSILRRVDLHNLKSIRRVMAGLAFSLDTFIDIPNIEMYTSQGLSLQEASWVISVLNAIKRNGDEYPLLRQAVNRFTAARSSPDSMVICATEELEKLAREDVLALPGVYPEEYELAVLKFEGRVQKKDSQNVPQTPNILSEISKASESSSQYFSEESSSTMRRSSRSISAVSSKSGMSTQKGQVTQDSTEGKQRTLRSFVRSSMPKFAYREREEVEDSEDSE